MMLVICVTLPGGCRYGLRPPEREKVAGAEESWWVSLNRKTLQEVTNLIPKEIKCGDTEKVYFFFIHERDDQEKTPIKRNKHVDRKVYAYLRLKHWTWCTYFTGEMEMPVGTQKPDEAAACLFSDRR